MCLQGPWVQPPEPCSPSIAGFGSQTKATHSQSLSHWFPPSQEVETKQKKASLSEEEDSGVEVYYREGHEEVGERSTLPKVRRMREQEGGGGQEGLGGH